MAILKIIKFPDKRLREPAQMVTDALSETECIKYLNDMEDTLEAHPNGAALAANQVGIPWRFIVFRQTDKFSLPPWVANPVIEKESDLVGMNEGCLSFPNFFRKVSRYDNITVTFDELSLVDGRLIKAQRTETHSGFSAQVWQHEIAHLNGVLFVDDLSKSEREKIAVQLMRKR